MAYIHYLCTIVKYTFSTIDLYKSAQAKIHNRLFIIIIGNYSACQNQLIDIDFDETDMS